MSEATPAAVQNATRRLEIQCARVGAGILFLVFLVTRHDWFGGHLALALAFHALCFGLVLSAMLGRLWSALYISGYKSERFITEGPYSMMRHPLYFFSLLGAVGVTLATQNAWCVLGVAVFYAVRYPHNVIAEEALLRERFGQDYIDYCSSTPRFWPHWSARREAFTHLVNTRAFLRAMLDAAWFLWVLMLVWAVHILTSLWR